jgi:hypothetical protein
MNTGAGKSDGARGSQYSHLDIQGTDELGLRCSSELGVTLTPNSCRNLWNDTEIDANPGLMR